MTADELRYVGQYATAIVSTWDVTRYISAPEQDDLERFERACPADRLETLQDRARSVALELEPAPNSATGWALRAFDVV